MTQTSHHLHKRIRVYKKLEPYPHPEKWKNFMDKAVFVAGIVGPIMTIPQAIKIFMGRNAAGVSAISWGAYFLTSLIWIIYGIMHKEKPIIFTFSIWAILDLLVVIGAIMYG